MCPEARFVQELFAVSRKWRTHFDARVREQGLTLGRARVLLRLAEKDGVTQRELADLLEIETPTLVRLLDALADQGFVERRSVDGDRRTKHVVLTETARQRAMDLKGFSDNLRDELMQDVDPKDLAAAIRVLAHIGARLEAKTR